MEQPRQIRSLILNFKLNTEEIMQSQYFEQFTSKINQFDLDSGLNEEFKISSGPGGFETYYAPFEHVNRKAKVIICGITPGLQQANVALETLHLSLKKGLSENEALARAKQSASFAGVMRTNIAKLFDYIGLSAHLGITDGMELFSSQSHLVHYTSALRYPVLKNGKNYSGDRAMINTPYLWNQSKAFLSEEAKALPNAIWVPLGDSVAAVLSKLVQDGVLNHHQVLSGLPHPSGANAERIKYFVEEKDRQNLSSKTNADKIDTARQNILSKMKSIAA